MNDKVSSELKITREERISVPSPDTERRMGIREADWERIKNRISDVSHPIPWLSMAYSVLFGIFGTTGVSIVPLMSSQGLSPWVIPAYACSCVSSLILGVVFVCLDRKGHAKRKSDLFNIKTDMEGIEKMFK